MVPSWKIKLQLWPRWNCHKIRSHPSVSNLFYSCQGKTAVYDGNLNWSWNLAQTCHHMTNLTPLGRARNFYAWKSRTGGGKKKGGKSTFAYCWITEYVLSCTHGLPNQSNAIFVSSWRSCRFFSCANETLQSWCKFYSQNDQSDHKTGCVEYLEQ